MRWGSSPFSVGSFLSPSSKINLRGTLLYFEKLVMKVFMHRRRGITVFSSFFCLTFPKTFVGGDTCASERFWYGKKTMVNRVVSHFLAKNFLSHSAEKFVRNILVWRKVNYKGRLICFSVESFLSTVSKGFAGVPLCFRNVLVWKELHG